MKMYENWNINNKITCYSNVLWEYQGVYFVQNYRGTSSLFGSVEIIPKHIYETIADEIYENAVGKSIHTFNNHVTDNEIVLFTNALTKLEHNHILLILSYIVDEFYHTDKSSNNAKRLLINFIDYFDDIQDKLHNIIKDGLILGNTVDDAMVAIDNHFIGDEVEKFNL